MSNQILMRGRRRVAPVTGRGGAACPPPDCRCRPPSARLGRIPPHTPDPAPNVPVLIDTSRVEYCDGGGIAMLVDLLRHPRPPEAQVSVVGLKPQFQTLLDQIEVHHAIGAGRLLSDHIDGAQVALVEGPKGGLDLRVRRDIAQRTAPHLARLPTVWRAAGVSRLMAARVIPSSRQRDQGADAPRSPIGGCRSIDFYFSAFFACST